MGNRLVLVRAVAVQNEQNFVEYVSRRKEIKAAIQASPYLETERANPRTMDCAAIKQLGPLEADVQEAWLWHGTTQKGSEGITNEDFRISLAGSAAGTLYGRGVYLAECCSKSDEYTEETDSERYLLLCRATLGRINYTDEVRPDTTALEQSCLTGKYNSVLGDREKARGTFKEFMVYDDDQVYPAYI